MVQRTKKPLLSIELPFPPSVNTYWRGRGKRRFINKKGVLFRQEVVDAVKSLYGEFQTIDYLVRITMDLEPPDPRTRDLDNFDGKAMFDALKHAGVITDDRLIKARCSEMHPPCPPGRVILTLWKYEPRKL